MNKPLNLKECSEEEHRAYDGIIPLSEKELLVNYYVRSRKHTMEGYGKKDIKQALKEFHFDMVNVLSMKDCTLFDFLLKKHFGSLADE